MDWWALSNASLIVWICLAVHEILADKAFTATDGLISQSFVVAFVHPTHMRLVLIWGFPVQLSLWKSVYWLWRYKLNEVCDISYEWCQNMIINDIKSFHKIFEKTILSWIPFLRSTSILISSSSKNCLGPLFALSLALETAKENPQLV